ncbi:MAG: metallophosphoesterase family protein [Candidatus Aenigmarchaeota archaeon]|nr:metallophosphoesterase family protein [Candidatus Aenigmarchaeota archaeon]
MKIAVLSDFHLGFSVAPDTANDAFENAKEAIERAIEENVDLIIIGGDIFDSRSPNPKTWYSVLKLLSFPLKVRNPGIRLVASSKRIDKVVYERTLKHLPIIALHGNHDRNPKGDVNIVEALENAGLLIHLHMDYVEFEKEGERVRIWGMSHVPERFAYEALTDWNPKPIENCINILLLHQNIDPYVYSFIEKPTIKVSNLPQGFDLIVNGHIHEFSVEKIDSSLLLMPGSTLVTQFKSTESGKTKGFVVLEISKNKVEYKFVELKNSRKFYYFEIRDLRNLEEEIRKRLEELKDEKKPIVRFKLIGNVSDLNENELRKIEKKYREIAIILFSKELYSPELEEKMEILNELKSQEKSIFEKGLSILEKNLKELRFSESFDWEKIFHMLAEDEVENALNLLVERQRTLESLLSKSLKEW